MQITFKLFATLTDYLPAEARRSNQMIMDVAPGASISQIIEPFGMPPKLVHLVLVNGKYIAPENRGTHALVDGDVLAIWPPVAGG
jgi:molybdopterin converting factor small subunit